MALQASKELSPAPIENVLIVATPVRWHKQTAPLRAVGVHCHLITGSKWTILPKALAHAVKFTNVEIDAIVSTCWGTHATAGMMLSDIFGAPVVLRMRGDMWGEYEESLSENAGPLNRARIGLLRRYTDYNLRKMHAVLPVARHMGETARTMLPEVGGSIMPVPVSVRSIPSPPDDLDEVRQRWASNDQRIVASITNFRYWQKASPMLDAAPKLAEVLQERELLWVIAGTGIFADRFFAELSEHCPEHLWVRADFIEDPWALLYASSAFLHLSRMDGMPNVIMEAQMCGCPVIANDHPAMAELLDHESTGLLVGDPADAADETERLLADEVLRETLIAEGRRYVLDNHTEEAVGRSYVEALGAVKAACDRQ